MSDFSPCASSLWLCYNLVCTLKTAKIEEHIKKAAGVQFFSLPTSLCGHKQWQPPSPYWLFTHPHTPCIILKINVFSHCWCLLLSISRESLFTKTDQNNSAGCVTLCASREETHHSCCHWILFSSVANASICVVGLHPGIFPNKHKHVQHLSTAQKTIGQQLSLKPK